MPEEYRLIKIKSWRTSCAHYELPSYDGAPFRETLCGIEKLAEEWVDVDPSDALPTHTICVRAARSRAKKAEQRVA